MPKVIILLLLMLACFHRSETTRAQAVNEYQVKAAFILNFAKFVEWPGDTLNGGTIVVGIVGDDPFGGALDQLVHGNSAQGRQLVVRHFKSSDDLRRCHILFISSSEKRRFDQILNSIRDSSVLTIGEASHFNQAGGVIRFFIQDNKVRFEINATAAGQARLKISSKLLALSKGGR
jgi:YfiR/HmsC-like